MIIFVDGMTVRGTVRLGSIRHGIGIAQEKSDLKKRKKTVFREMSRDTASRG